MLRKSILLFSSLFLFNLLKPSNLLAAPPSGFQTSLLIGSGLNSPTGLGIAPDGRIFILEQGGGIKIYKNGKLLDRMFDELTSVADGDRGLLGIAFDPNFTTNHYVYFYYTGSDLYHHVVRFNASDDIATDGPVPIYTSTSKSGSNHAGGTIQFGPDNKLYISIGEAGQPKNAQDLSNVLGKVLRINPDGSIPSDNPFTNTPGAKPEIWAYGLRNPFRFQFDSVTGNLFLGDVGNDKWEEINKIEAGFNYGWPVVEGNCDSCPYTNPLFSYFHQTPTYSITGGPVYRGTVFPSEYQGRLFYGDYGRGWIKTLTFNPDSTVTDTSFEPQAGTVVDIKTGLDGSLYFVTIYPGRVYRISYPGSNPFPVAISSSDINSGHEPLTVSFSSLGSSDPQEQPLTYLWDFGDGTSSSLANPVKTYSSNGKYLAQLTVSDGQNSIPAIPLEINIGTPPAVNIDLPQSGFKYSAGDTVNYSASGNATSYSTEIIFHHSTHIHPFIRPHLSQAGSFTISTIGEPSADTWYEIQITGTDPDGLITTASQNIYPNKSTVTLQTDPLQMQISLDGSPVTTPYTFEGIVGFQRIIDALTQNKSDTIYEFDHWLDEVGSSTRTIEVPASPATYTANFRTVPPFLGEYFNNPDLTGIPTFTRSDPQISFGWPNTPDPLITNSSFSIRWTKTQEFNPGKYIFNTSSDDGHRLFIDSKSIIDNWSSGIHNGSTVVDLSGRHEIKMEYFNAGGGNYINLNWKLSSSQAQFLPTSTPTPAPAPTNTPTPYPTATPTPTLPSQSQDGFVGEYFANMTFSGKPALTRVDPKISFGWFNSPDPLLPSDQYSIRWIGSQVFTEGWHKFTAIADDGVRVFVDGSQVIDGWRDQPITKYQNYKYLTAGRHEIKVEYYEAFGGSAISYDSELVNTSPTSWLGEYYSNKNLSGYPTLINLDPTLVFVWNENSPSLFLPKDRFSVRWTKKQFLPSGTYSFTLKSDDGIRFWINDQLIVDDWTDHPMRTYTPSITLLNGIYDLKIEYYENSGSAVAIFTQN